MSRPSGPDLAFHPGMESREMGDGVKAMAGQAAPVVTVNLVPMDFLHSLAPSALSLLMESSSVLTHMYSTSRQSCRFFLKFFFYFF